MAFESTSITGSLFGTASWAVSSSYALTASTVTTVATSVWTTFTPTLKATTTDPNIISGTITGRYRYVGENVEIEIYGKSLNGTAGNGTYYFDFSALPFVFDTASYYSGGGPNGAGASNAVGTFTSYMGTITTIGYGDATIMSNSNNRLTAYCFSDGFGAGAAGISNYWNNGFFQINNYNTDYTLRASVKRVTTIPVNNVYIQAATYGSTTQVGQILVAGGSISAPNKTLLTINLPSAGTYKLEAFVNCGVSQNMSLGAGIYTPAGTVIAGSSNIVINSAGGYIYSVIPLTAFVQTTSSANYTLRAWATGGTTDSMTNADGRNTIMYWTKIG